MNTKVLVNLYDRLTPRERASATLAAERRQDLVELERLISAAPKVVLQMPHHVGREFMLRLMVSNFLDKIIPLALSFWQKQFCLAVLAHDPKSDPEVLDRTCRLRVYIAAGLVNFAEAFRLFCATHRIPDDDLTRFEFTIALAKEILPKDLRAVWQEFSPGSAGLMPPQEIADSASRRVEELARPWESDR